MGLPEIIRVKLSSETAESISLTPVVVQELAVRDLVEHMLGVTGKDEPRIREILLRGTMVSGASRFRWSGWKAEPEAVQQLLATFPDPDPSRPFAAERCVRAILRGGRQAIDIPKEAASHKGLFRRETFWDVLMGVITGPAYAGYSYRDRADRYVREFTPAESGRVRAGADGVRYSTLRDQIRTVAFAQAELYVTRR
ncbi:MAG TPA: hypothetical protein VE959_00965 [Bryobacteraceae bacterium]|nr:hypothetical protein [Bryobacteraceae bacterium]